jgi:PhzF family phenazine biosynthesis protein
VQLKSAEQVLALSPDYPRLNGLFLGVVAAQPEGSDTDFEVRGFVVPSAGGFEDPVTGSLNAGIAQWMIGAGKAKDHYIVSQGTVLQRKGRVYIDRVGEEIWVGGEVVICIDGSVTL